MNYLAKFNKYVKNTNIYFYFNYIIYYLIFLDYKKLEMF